MVSPAGGQKDQLTGQLVMNRRNDSYVGQVRAASKWIVGDINVSGCEVGHIGEQAFDRFAHRPKMDGNVWSIDHQIASRRKDRTTEIEAFFDVRRKRGHLKRDAHLFGDRGEKVVEDFQRDGVDVFGLVLGSETCDAGPGGCFIAVRNHNLATTQYRC